MNKLLISFISVISIALVWGIAFMYFFGDIVGYYLQMERGVGFYAMGGGLTVALTFMLTIDIVLCIIYFKRVIGKKESSYA